MSRTISSAALKAMFAQETDECFLFIVEVDHTLWANPIRVVNNNEDIVSNGETFQAYPFELLLPVEDSDQPQPQTSIRCDNVDLQISSALRELATGGTAVVSVILGSTPDNIEAGPFKFKVTGYNSNVEIIEIILTFENILNEPIPADTFNPAHYPGLF